MRKVVLHVAMSLDGYLARENGAVDWLHSEDQEEEASSFDAFYDTVDTLIMGRKTFTQVVEELSPERWVYEGKSCLVYTKEKRPKGHLDQRGSFSPGEGLKETRRQGYLAGGWRGTISRLCSGGPH